MCLIHKWFTENAYYVDSDIGSELAGTVRICLKCGKIILIGNCKIPQTFIQYKNNINNGRKYWENGDS